MTAGDAIAWSSIAVGGAAGALLRLALLGLAGRFDPAIATLAANLLACVLLGAVTPDAGGDGSEADALQPALSAFLTIGLCGSLSTFSTLCGDAIRQLRAGARRGWIASLTAHLLGGPLAFAFGSLLGG